MPLFPESGNPPVCARACVQEGAVSIQADGERYVYATFQNPLGNDDVEFLLPDGDTTVGGGLRASDMLEAARSFAGAGCAF